MGEEVVDVEAVVEARLKLAQLERAWNGACGLTFLEAVELSWPGKGATDNQKQFYWHVKKRLYRLLKMSKKW